jgi:hypothetical protein
MNRRKYTKEEREFFIEYIPGHSHKEVVKMFSERFEKSVTLGQVQSYAGNHKLKTGKVIRLNSQRKYTKEEREFILKHVLGHSHKEIVGMFNEYFEESITLGQMKSYIGNYKLKTGRTGQFEKGNKPYNKGIKRGSFGRMAETQFKKGITPPRHRKIGSTRVDKDGTLYIKVAEPNIWKSKQKIVWEKHHGELSKGNIITFLDGNTDNYEIENLAAVDRATNLILNRNKLRTKNKALSEVGVSTAKLIREIQRREHINGKKAKE